jgi:hypothetical protein
MLTEVLRSVFDIARLKCAVLRILAKSVEDLYTLLQTIGKKLQAVDFDSFGMLLGPTGHPNSCLWHGTGSQNGDRLGGLVHDGQEARPLGFQDIFIELMDGGGGIDLPGYMEYVSQ